MWFFSKGNEVTPKDPYLQGLFIDFYTSLKRPKNHKKEAKTTVFIQKTPKIYNFYHFRAKRQYFLFFVFSTI